jgi:hypothetical protein
MNANYKLIPFYGGNGTWLCRIEFAGMGLGNTPEAERIAYNAIANAKRRIRVEISERMLNTPKRLTYQVKTNTFCPCGCNRLTALTITAI